MMMAAASQRRVLVLAGAPTESGPTAREILEPAGFLVDYATDPDSALDLARRENYDAFLLNVENHGEEGIALCRQLRDEPGYYLSPILLTASANDRATWQTAFAAGCDDLLRLPLEPVVVRARLVNLLEKADYAQELERVRANLARYVSPRLRQIVQEASPGAGLPPPEQQHVCILFSDIRGFTALAQSIQPSQLFASVSRHLGSQVEAVYAHGGYVDKFGGDGIMAVFDGNAMAEDACACALEMIQANQAMQAEELSIPLGIGIHEGPVVAGNIGTGEHLDYTVIGNTVNLAARLCGWASPGDIVVSEAVRQAINGSGEFTCIEPRTANIRGLNEAITLYRLEGDPPATAGER
ncbi:adenylate/guanylate cyclase domain-containing response regulator [Aquisalimonas sp. 2447]|uniref:adenylate/guanylate cyclase domain-containing response regulator n=1 Tax=Aquisalimonas sp. 2447 TaxID=2740807 RepID=UPI0014327323|nr:adenylate/guanylate cyclase domain-containing response regulator [Aquisalimonas sp. 2447]QIT56889.1 adenylate/guanylate cyclase domain-containing response regulator [Aquisalimonas sp. 2447]